MVALAACTGTVPDGPAPPAPLRPAVQFGEIDVDGQRRTYRVFAPPTVEPRSPVPLVVALHDSFANAEAFREVTQFDRAARAGNFVVVYPESLGDSWNAGFCCGIPAEQGVDDLGFLTGLLEEVTSDYPVDPTRIYAVGASAGAMMAYKLGCEMAGRVAGVAAVGGAMVMDDCRPGRPVPILALHGTEDAQVPYEGGHTGGSPTPAPSQGALMQAWAERNGCAEDPSKETDGPVTTMAWEDCQGGGWVRLVTVQGAGHTWFASEFGGVAAAVDATQVITEHFDLVPQ